MKRIFKNKIILYISAIILFDIIIGYFLFTNRSFPRLAMWKIIESNKYKDFYWEPQNKPDFFYFESLSDKLLIFRDEILPLVKNETDEFKKTIEIAKHVKAIGVNQKSYKEKVYWSSPEGILKQIREGRSGNCFHYSILYSTYVSSIGTKSRLWTLEGDDGLEFLSHTVNEIYLTEIRKWVLVDVFWGVYFRNKNNNSLLSVLELRDSLLKGNKEKILVERISERLDDPGAIIQNYTRLLKCVFLRTGNDFVNKYNDTKLRYGALNKLQGYLDNLPSAWRRALEYLFGRKDPLMHYVDNFSRSLSPDIVIARAFFYLFIFLAIIIFSSIVIILCSIFYRSKIEKIRLKREI